MLKTHHILITKYSSPAFIFRAPLISSNSQEFTGAIAVTWGEFTATFKLNLTAVAGLWKVFWVVIVALNYSRKGYSAATTTTYF